MRKKEINLINRVMKKIYLVEAILLIAGVCSCEKNDENYIKGVDPTAITAAFKHSNFKTDRSFNAEYGNLWSINGEDIYSSYNILLFSKNSTTKIESITVNALLKSPDGNIDYSLFQEMAMQTKEECDPNIVSNWLSIHYNNPGDTIINKVCFSITEPSELSKTLTIKKVLKESTDNI